jgi:hypothetical protein
MNETDRRNKNLVLIQYLNSIISGYKVKAEYSTNDKDIKVIVVQETSGQKIVFFDNDNPLYNYFNIEIFSNSIEEAYKTSAKIGDLIGKNIYIDFQNQKWQIMIKQYSNPRTLFYEDIRRVGYIMTLQCIVNRIDKEASNGE